MAGWTTLHSPWVNGEVATAAELQAFTDNINFLGSIAGSVIGASETTTSTTYTGLSTTGPSTTVTTGTQALVIVGCLMTNDTAGAETHMSVSVSGATTTVAADINSVMWTAPIANGFVRMSNFFFLGLAAGVNVFTGQYRVSAGTGTFSERRIAVIPMP